MFLTKLSTQNPMSQLVFTARELWKIPKTNFLIYQYAVKDFSFLSSFNGYSLAYSNFNDSVMLVIFSMHRIGR